MARHFFKTLIIFLIMIGLGLIGVFLVNYFDKSKPINSNLIQVAK